MEKVYICLYIAMQKKKKMKKWKKLQFMSKKIIIKNYGYINNYIVAMYGFFLRWYYFF